MSLISDERVEELLEKEERLEAEIERLRLKLGQAEKIAKLLPESAAEIERLRAVLEEQNGTMAIMRIAHNAKIERLRAALEKIAKCDDVGYGPSGHCVDIAIRALKDKP